MMKKHINYLDLFSGIGAFALGLLTAGYSFKNHYYSEIDKYAIANYQNNFKNAQYAGDIRKIKKNQIEKPDLITFGSPCQNLSIAGNHKGITGQKSSLFFDAVKIIEWYKPHCFVFENVKGLLQNNQGKDFEIVLQKIAELGVYVCQWQLINSAWFLPQNRERLYLVGHLAKEGARQVFPLKLPGSQSTTDQPKVEIIGRTNKFGNVGIIVNTNRLASTLMATGKDGNSIFYDKGKLRRLTPLECERLQGLPDNWTACGLFKGETLPISDTQRYIMLGNSVTVPIVTAIGKALIKN